ncbi:unnamed protein product, partial [Didymodactylos carnosus]
MRYLFKVLPSNHPDIATTYTNVAELYDTQEDYVKEIEYLNKTLEIQLNSLPPSHPDVAVT